MAAADDPFAPPSADPADALSTAGVLRLFGRKLLQNLDDCLPCTVAAVQGRTRVTVQPVVMMATTDGQKISRAKVPSVPIFNMGAGGFVLSFPVKIGDFGWLKATDRDISLFLQGLAEDGPNTARQHSFQDGFFIPDVMREWTLAGEDADRIVLQSIDGASRIAIGMGTVKVTTPLFEVDAATAHFTGDVTADGHVTGNGIVLDTHTHPTGGPNTGAPNP